MKQLILLFFAVGVNIHANTLPDWFVILRDAVYAQQITAHQITPLYRQATAGARASLSGAPLYIMLSRSEYMMGRAYQFENRNNEAITHYEEGLRLAERALEIQPSAEAWQMMGENISQLCAVRSTAFAMANGLKVERYAKNALAIDSRNAAAQIMIAARWVYAPAPFNNLRRGIEMMSAIPLNSNMQKDDTFNVYAAIGYAYLELNSAADARPWLIRALEVYPTNRFARGLLDRT